ncbi:MAG: MmcQ/YjbR family DNA-binding protein [Anaerolineales bacterium]
MTPLTLVQLDEYFLSKPGAEASYPFGEGARVYKVMNKMFGLIGEEAVPLQVNLKCDPDDALALRDQYKAIIPGYHMNKKHWNSLNMDGTLPENLVHELIDHSYELVVAKLSQTKQRELAALKKGHL